jgi:hypothetical protein
MTQVASTQLGNEDAHKEGKASLLDGVDPVDIALEGSPGHDCPGPVHASPTDTVAEVASPDVAPLGDVDVPADAVTDVAGEIVGGVLEVLGGMLDGL